ncbi:MAG: STAS domain-containing protein [Chitinispirillaceae bacterium]|jgi:anti-anti-sigma factor|nr:STAS domain-containing protein [Chitinispirillaceae bacterium]
MNIDLSSDGGYQIIKIQDDLSVIAELSELRYLIEGYLAEGRKNIAISFAGTSYIYSGAIAVLIDCYKRIHAAEGTLCIIESNPQIVSVFRTLHIDKVIPIYPSFEDIPEAE